MFHLRRQTLPSNRRASTLLKNPGNKRASSWQRFSIKNSTEFEDAILESGLGLHPDFMIPTQPRRISSRIMRLDGLRLLNMGHLNERYHQDHFHTPKRRSQMVDGIDPDKVRKEVPNFPLRQVLKTARRSLQPMMVKVRLDVTPEPGGRDSASAVQQLLSSRCSIEGGFFTVGQGIGTARASSPKHQKKWFSEVAPIPDEDPIYKLSLVKQAGIKSRAAKKVPDGTEVFSPIAKRLNKRAQKASIWADSVNPKVGDALKQVQLVGVAAAAQKVHQQLQLEPPPTPDNPWPTNTFLRMQPTKDMRCSERITPDQQKRNLQKGFGIGAKTQMLDYATKAESLRRQMDPAKHKEEARFYLCKGVLHDNAQEYQLAVDMYMKYLDISERIDDKDGQALAHNFIGCSYQEKENTKLDAIAKSRFDKSAKLEIPESSIAEFEKALEHHKLACEKTNVEGKFICYTNLGLLCSTLSMWAEAGTNHKKALKCATVLEDSRGQCTAVGNLGYLLYKRKKYDAAKACLMRYVQICKVVNFIAGTARGHFYLGDIEARQKRYEMALVDFKNAARAAEECGDTTIQTLSRVQIGICEGENALKKLAENADSQSIFETASNDL